MNNIRKVILRVYTNWCGEDQNYSAIICDECESDFEQQAQNLAYENFRSFGGFEAMMRDEFGEPNEDDEWTEEELQEGYELESSYFGYEVIDYDEGYDGEWDWYDLIFDCTDKL